MNAHNYLQAFEDYHLYKSSIHSLLTSMMSSLDAVSLLDDRNAQIAIVASLEKHYPFVEVIYSLDAQGIQLMDTVCSTNVTERHRRTASKGKDRSFRPYVTTSFESNQRITVTEPYLSTATHQLAVSCSQIALNEGKNEGILVLNVNLQRLITYLKGDELRCRFHPLFRSVYGLIGGALVFVSMLLLLSAGLSAKSLIMNEDTIATGAFGIVILITLALAIFDLGKTILEEEVLADKDIHNHGSSRRTITRFMSAIVIAVSIESLLLMFKSLLGGQGEVINAVWMLIAAVLLLSSLGVYLKLSRE